MEFAREMQAQQDASGQSAPPSAIGADQLDGLMRVEAHMMTLDPWYSIGSSLLFELVVVLAAMWTFSRQDF